MHFRCMVLYLLKSKEEFVLLSNLLEASPDQENERYIQCFWVKEHEPINRATVSSRWHLCKVIAGGFW